MHLRLKLQLADRHLNPSLGHRIARFVQPCVMPYSAGSFASVLMFFLMFTALRPHFVALREAALRTTGSVIVVHTFGSGLRSLSTGYSEGLAASRAPFGEESPT